MISSLEAYQAGRVDQSGFEHPVGTLDDQAGEAGPGRLVRDEIPGREKLEMDKARPGRLVRDELPGRDGWTARTRLVRVGWTGLGHFLNP